MLFNIDGDYNLFHLLILFWMIRVYYKRRKLDILLSIL